MYTVSEKTYPMKDMVHFDGQNVEAWINADLRQLAIAEGYPINADEMDEVNMDWSDKLRMVCKVVIDDGDVNVYKAALHSPKELISSKGVTTPSAYS